MESTRDQDSQLRSPESIQLRDSPFDESRTSYRHIPFEEDFDNSDRGPGMGAGNSSPPVLPTISRLGRSLGFGLGIRDPEGPLLRGQAQEPVTSTDGPWITHSRQTSFPDSDLGTPAGSHGQFAHLSPSESSRTEPGNMGSPEIVYPDEEPKGYPPNVHCPSRRKVTRRRASWLSISILTLAFYSTAFSGVYLVVAFVRPRFGKRIGHDGGIAPSTASLLSAFFAKTIELSFVTVFVAFLGQVLTRRSLAEKSAGITVADMSMRSWIMQPGTLITHWENVKHAGLTFLGMISLTAALMAMLYTTAAETLVSPNLRFGPVEERVLYGQVSTKFANTDYLEEHCRTPITNDMDPDYGGSTCLQMYHVSQAYHNYQQYIETWGTLVDGGWSVSSDLLRRPLPVGTWYDNTTVTGSWIEVREMAKASAKHERMINNVTAAMPHAGVYISSRDPANALRQPSDFDGQGEFNISASVPSPFVNVLCAGMTEEELEPIIYKKWPHRGYEVDPSTWNQEQPADIPDLDNWVNSTVVDEIFNFGPEGEQLTPIFPKLPSEYNTLINGTGAWPANAVYVLGASPKYISDPPYVLCALKGGLTSKCSTQYHATASGGQLVAYCDDNDPLAYVHTGTDIPSAIYDPDWKFVANEWAKSVNLGDGLMDGQSSNARLLTQFIPPYDSNLNTAHLQYRLPSIAEALATLAGSTLLVSTEDTTFKHFWSYDTPVLSGDKPVYEQYSAKISISDYASGSTEPWQNAFFIVLVLVFLTNLVCLVYMYVAIRFVQLTDFTEPQNAFTLALNSPPSSSVSGACGGGPEGQQLKEKWTISMDVHDEHYYITSKSEQAEAARMIALKNQHLSPDLSQPPTPAVSEYRRLSQTKNSLSLLR